MSTTNPSNNKLTLSNYVKLQSQVSDTGLSKLQALVDAAMPYRVELTTDNGVQFKNNVAPSNTTLCAQLYKGSAITETITDSYEWFKNHNSIGTGQSLTVEASTASDTAVYSYEATINGGRKEVTITNVNDGAKGSTGPKGDPGSTGIAGTTGADGKTSYFHIAYATNSTGTTGFDTSNATGKTYLGQYTDFTLLILQTQPNTHGV